MYSTKVRDLKKDPRRALRQAQDAPVLIMEENEPDALAYVKHMLSEARYVVGTAPTLERAVFLSDPTL